jgi:hypothetical protein
MKKFAIVIILFFLYISSVSAEGIKIKTGKTAYLRYELVDMSCEYTGPMLDINGATDKIRLAAECSAKIFRDNRLMSTVGGAVEIPFHYDPVSKKWTGKWPIPWNPALGQYKAVVFFKSGTKKFAGTINFEVIRRIPLKMPKGFCVMDIEPGDSIISRVPGIGGKSVKIWENYVLWAKFMGADALWHCVGQSQIWNTFKPDDFPWDQITIKQIPELGEELHKYGMKYGAWITSFVVLGNRKDLSPYKQTISYDAATNSLKTLIYVSLLDEKRHQDMADLLKKFQDMPAVDYIGLDYMRTDFGGLEYTDAFIDDMPVSGVPRDWKDMTEEDRMLWMGKKLEIDKSKDFIEMWDWWRAHKASTVIAKLKQMAGITKPLWVFSLTWRQGKEHGQDPLMFIDAGVDINSGMFYSIDHDTYPSMLESWRDYLEKGSTNLCAGQCVDWNLLGRTYRPSGPDEHFIRQQMLVDSLLPVNPNLGLFWHDLTRAFKGSKGPYSSLEWAVAGAASFSYLRAREGVFPFEAKWELPDKVKRGEVFTIDINVKNTGQITMDFYLKLLKVSNLEMFGDITHKFFLAPGEIKTLTFQVKAMEDNYKKDYMQMIAYMLQYDGLSTQQRYFDFKYIEVK